MRVQCWEEDALRALIDACLDQQGIMGARRPTCGRGESVKVNVRTDGRKRDWERRQAIATPKKGFDLVRS